MGGTDPTDIIQHIDNGIPINGHVRISPSRIGHAQMTAEKIDNIILVLSSIVTITTPILLSVSIALEWIESFIR